MASTFYKEYLAGPVWARIRAKVLKRDRNKCRGCGRKRAIQVHHGRYDPDTMAGKSLHNLISLCGTCHYGMTFTFTGARRSAQEVAEWTDLISQPPGKKRKPKKFKAKRNRVKFSPALMTKDLSPRIHVAA